MINDTTQRDIPSLESWHPSVSKMLRNPNCVLQSPIHSSTAKSLRRQHSPRGWTKTIHLKPHLVVGLLAASFNQIVACQSFAHLGVWPFWAQLTSLPSKVETLPAMLTKGIRQVSNLFVCLFVRLFVCLFVCCIFTLTARTPTLYFPQKLSESSTYHEFPRSSLQISLVCWVHPVHPSFSHSTFTAVSWHSGPVGLAEKGYYIVFCAMTRSLDDSLRVK